MKSVFTLLFLAAGLCLAEEQRRADVIIYGGTSAAVSAAVQVKRLGKSVIIVSPDQHLGGLSSSGLGWTDTGNKAMIGGLARDFYHRVWKHYQTDSAWNWQKRSQYGNKGQGSTAIDDDQQVMWVYEPHVAEKIFEDYCRENHIPVDRNEWLDRQNGVVKVASHLRSFRTLSGKVYHGKMFLDATYEGDLMAASGVHYHVGREANTVYQENWNGVQPNAHHHRHGFHALSRSISAYVEENNPASGLLPYCSAEPLAATGSGDRKIQAYCFRMCLSNDPANRITFTKPAGYDPKNYELLARIYATGWNETFAKFDPLPNHKTDTNNHGPFSTDMLGANADYPEASYEQRKKIIREHELYQKGWLYFLSSDPRVPAEVRKKMNEWGLPKDEFQDNGGWPHQLYIREARRMIGHHIMTEHQLTKTQPTPEPVGMGSYAIDSHNVQRYVTAAGMVANEGDIGVALKAPYQISYGALLPKQADADNLLVPICVSSSHIAYGSIRMEPVFMILGQSAATAAVLALERSVAVQQLPYTILSAQLQKDGHVLEAK